MDPDEKQVRDIFCGDCIEYYRTKGYVCREDVCQVNRWKTIAARALKYAELKKGES